MTSTQEYPRSEAVLRTASKGRSERTAVTKPSFMGDSSLRVLEGRSKRVHGRGRVAGRLGEGREPVERPGDGGRVRLKAGLQDPDDPPEPQARDHAVEPVPDAADVAHPKAAIQERLERVR